jgi:hypothetical protein
MSYSHGVRAANKAEAKAAIAQKMAETAMQQPCHAADKDQAIAAASAFIDILPDDDSKDVVVSMNGPLSGLWVGHTIERISSSAVSVTACLADRQA